MNYSGFEKLFAELDNSLIWEVQQGYNTCSSGDWRIRPFSEFASIYKNMIYLVKTTDKEVKLFTSKPTKVKHHYLVDSGEEEEDYHGHFHKVQIPSKEYFECWEDGYGRYGISLDISNFSDKIINQLEIDKPLEIN